MYHRHWHSNTILITDFIAELSLSFFLYADDILIWLIESLHCNFYSENNIDVLVSSRRRLFSMIYWRIHPEMF